MVNKKVNNNDKLQKRRPFKAHYPDLCIMCWASNHTIDHPFLQWPPVLGFNTIHTFWVYLGTPRSMGKMMDIYPSKTFWGEYWKV